MPAKLTSAPSPALFSRADRFKAEAATPINYATIFRLGWYFLKQVRGSALFYMMVYLLALATGLGVTQMVAHLTALIRDSQTYAQTAPALLPGVVGSLLLIYGVWLVLVLMGILLSALVKMATARMDVRMANEIRQRMFQKLLGQSPEFFHENDPGRLTMTINQLSIEAQMTMRQVIVDPILQIVSLLATGALLSYNFSALIGPKTSHLAVWECLACVTVFALLSPWVVNRLGKRLQTASHNLQEQNLLLAGLIQGALGAPEEIQALKAEEVFSRKHSAGLDGLLQARLRQTKMVEMVNSFNALPAIIVQACFLGLAVFMVVRDSGHANVGAVVAVYMLAPQFMAPIHSFATYLMMARSSWPSVRKIAGLLESLEPQRDKPEAVDVPEIEPSIEARDVVFRYRMGQPPIFQGLSFTAKPGKISGIVAQTGQGKTSFFRLLLRFYEPEAGSILIGGRPVDGFILDSLRHHAAMLSQFPTFFHDTVRENLRLARLDATDEEIREVCERTGMWEILDEKFGESPLDEQFSAGLKLSGGEKKLMALTRCLLRNPEILLLDEPTAGMDSIEKTAMIAPLREACRGKTVLVADHDMSWLLGFCDEFIIIHDGKVTQSGDGAKLLQERGLFRSLYEESRPDEAPVKVVTHAETFRKLSKNQ
jgi:ATP-binding cassette subfamily B protein